MLSRLGIPLGDRAIRILDWIQILALAGLIIWVILSFVTVRMWVPTNSMEPTIMAGESFFVDRISYLLGLRRPKPGDIIVFWHTDWDKLCRSGFLFFRWGEWKPCRERLVKRLIAVGGQTVVIKQGKLYVNGQLMTDPAFDHDYLCEPSEWKTPPAQRTRECSWTVPEGHYFALGDNSPQSKDSRYWGFVEEHDFIGEPFLRVWPISRVGPMNGYLGSQR